MRRILYTLRLVLLGGLTMGLLYTIFNYNLVCYGLSQLKGQLHIVMAARPVAEILQDKTFPDSLKDRLRLVAFIRRFAIDSLGLKDSKNYTTVYDQQGKPALWVLTACEPFAMKAYEWKFPMLGAVSYKGFFEKEKGLPELNELKQRGYDTDYAPTGGWSTLGWFKDPILSNMLKRTEGQLAELIIHELTHATLYLPGSVDFNENFATFTGEQGALLFLAAHFGKSSPELKAYIDLQHDEEIFGQYMVNACTRLDSLYQQLKPETDKAVKDLLKRQVIQNIVLNINTLDLRKPERFRLTGPSGTLPNNCIFMSYRRYRRQQTAFREEFNQFRGNLKAWLLHIKARRESGQ